MCGFIIAVNESNLLINFKKNKLNVYNHRGPDNTKYFSNKNISILFRRLSIVDLSKKSDQPTFSENLQYTLVFNGEIYNYKELRENLINRNVKFKSNGEAEVLLKGFINYGEKFIDEVRGMFSICLWDNNKKKLIVYRDRFGQKPLYYYKTKKGIIFSSEIKDINYLIKCEENFEISKRYIYRGLLDKGRETFFKKINRVLPSEKIIFYNNKLIREIYWKPKVLEYRKFDKEEFLFRYLENLNIHLNADVKLAFLLSGGLDSSSLVAGAIHLKKKIKAFSILPKHTINEKPYIDSLVKKYSISHDYIDIKETLNGENFEKVLFHQDEPFQGINCFYQFYLQREIKKKGFKVLITGDGGDEVLGGYDRMFLIYMDYLIKNKKENLFLKILKSRKLNKTEIISKIKKFNYSLQKNISDFEDNSILRYLNKKTIISNSRIFHEKWNDLNINTDKNLFKKTLFNSIFTNDLQMSLRMADRNAMASSLENRAPILDHVFIDYVFSIKTEDFYIDGKSKGMLRNSIKEISDNKIVNRKRKSGRPGNDIYFIFFSVFDELIELLNISNIGELGIDKKYLLNDLLKMKKYFKTKIKNFDRSTRQAVFFFFRLYCYLKWKNLQRII